VIAAYPRSADFERAMIDAFYEGMRHRPDSTYGTFNDEARAVAVGRSSGRKRSLGPSRVGQRAGAPRTIVVRHRPESPAR
jgi:hypothetical protein